MFYRYDRALKEWIDRKDSQQARRPEYPKTTSIPITVGQRTVAIAVGLTREQSESHAARIVAAVNSHEDLVEALNLALAAVTNPQAFAIEQVRADLRTVLAKASPAPLVTGGLS